MFLLLYFILRIVVAYLLLSWQCGVSLFQYTIIYLSSD